MKGELKNYNGYRRLHIYYLKGDELRLESANCPHYCADPCGEWCILFGEPYTTTKGIAIDLCTKTVYFEELIVNEEGKRL